MNKRTLIIISLPLFLAACGQKVESSESSPSSSSSSSVAPIEPIDPLEAFQSLKNGKINYTIEVEDYGGNYHLYYMEDAFYVTYDDDAAYNGYLQDSQGVYPFNVTSAGKTTFGYYYYDTDEDENLKKIYDGMYSLADASFNASLYKHSEIRNTYTLATVSSDEGIVLFDSIGYIDTSTVSGAGLSDVKAIKLTADDYNNPQIIVDFNDKTSSRGTTTATIKNIGTTTLDSTIANLIKDGTQAKQRVATTDQFFSWLNDLANINNFTLEVASKYIKDGYTNYTLTSKYTSVAYYSYTDRGDEEDLGYIFKDGSIYNLYLDDISGTYLTGTKVETDDTPTSLYSFVNSFADFPYYPASFEARKDGNKYIIEDEEYLLDAFGLIDETLYRLQLSNVELAKEDYGYLFTFNLVDGQTIEMKVKDIGKTAIGSYK